jgi:hypothetical protein
MLNITQPYNNQAINSQAQAFREWYMEQLNESVELTIQWREYDDGLHHVQLNDRTRQFLGVDANHKGWSANFCSSIIDNKAHRLNVSAFNTTNKDKKEDKQKDVLWDWWRKNRMDRKQGIVHRASIRDGNAYVLVSFDEKANQPRFDFEPTYAGEGMMAYYSDERRDEIKFVSKSWRILYGEGAGKKRRVNLYFPDRIEKYLSNDDVGWGNYQPFVDDTTDDVEDGQLGRAGVTWWTVDRTQSSEPLGIPIVHFKFNDGGDSYGTSVLTNVTPIQDAVNKSVIDLIGAADTAGFGLLVGFGGDWTTAKVGPGAIVSTNKSPSEADLRRLAADNLEQLIKVYQAFVMDMARVSSTPLSHFQISGQVAAEGTMKQQETALVEQIKKTQVDYGNNWEDVLKIGRRLYNTFAKGKDVVKLDEDVMIDTIWKDAESRNEKEQAETLAIKVQALGVSEEQAWTELGYDATTKSAMRTAALKKQADALRNQVKMGIGNPQAGQQNMTQTENENDNSNTTNGNTQAKAV